MPKYWNTKHRRAVDSFKIKLYQKMVKTKEVSVTDIGFVRFLLQNIGAFPIVKLLENTLCPLNVSIEFEQI